MSTEVPESVDSWRMVAAGRVFEGQLPLAGMTRLAASLVDTQGEAAFVIEFGRDTLQVPYVAVRVSAQLPLLCQRTLSRFGHEVRIEQRYGLIRDEADEAGLPPDYEALLLAEDGRMQPAALVEDELILAVPLVPVAPGSETVERDWPAPVEEQARASPFSALAALKKD